MPLTSVYLIWPSTMLTDNLLAHEAELSRAQLNEMQVHLAEFEEQYGIISDEFYRRYRAGQTDDRMDLVEWASLVQMANILRRHLHVLTGGDGA